MQRRSLWLSVVVLGAVLTLVGGTGIFAPFTDTATTGTNSLTSGARPRAADIQIKWPASGTLACADPAGYVEDSTSPGHDVTDVQPGFSDLKSFCVRNVGTGTPTVAVRVIDRVETDLACTGDEAAAGDATCGGDGVGELGSVVHLSVYRFDCSTSASIINVGMGPIGLDPNHADPAWTLAPGEIWCGATQTFYPDSTPLTDVLQAQTDRVTWKFQFVANVP